MKTRARRCGAPTSLADIGIDRHAYPSSSKSRTMTSCHLRAPSVTFSTTTQRGRSSLMMRANSRHRPERFPARPAPFPAPERSWHGKPPQMRSTGARVARPTVHTSSNRFASGQCLASTALQKGSFSTCQSVGPSPAHSSPSSKPPIPANREPMVITWPPSPSRRPAACGAGRLGRTSQSAKREL